MTPGRRLALVGLLAGALVSPAGASPYRQPVNGDVVVTAYYDHGGVRDWACTDWTYGGHRGTDIAIIGRFAAQDEGRDITAAQAGRVTRTHDGEFDRCTTADCAGGNGFGNHVYVEHADGHVTIYAHMRQGSVRVAEGQQVNCGDVIGQVGSSGYSTGPHLHFEVRVGGNADDPFAGQCGGPLSYWVAQGDHRGLPSRDCAGGEPPPPPPPPARPDIHLSLAFEPAGESPRACDFDDCRDFVRDGPSGGLFDAWVGETFAVSVVVSNQGNGTTQGESPEDSALTLQYELPPGLSPVGYTIETDHPAQDRATWQPNDAMQNPANPPADAPPGAGELRLNGFGAGESKRVTLRVRATESSVPSGAHRPVRAWIKHLRGYYGEKTGWDDPAEVNEGQTYNGGDLKVGGELDVFDPTAFLFESPDAGMVEGWRRCAPDAVSGFVVNTTDHALASEITGPGPCIESPRVSVPLAGYAGVRLVARQHQTRRSGRLQWTTEAEPEFSEARSVEFHTDGGGTFDERWLAMPWDRGATLTRLRLLPVPDAGSGNAWFDLAELRLTADAPPPAPGIDAGPGPGPGGASGEPVPDPDDGVPGRPAPPDETPDAGSIFTGEPAAEPLPQSTAGAKYSGTCAMRPGAAPSVRGAWALLLGTALWAARRRRRPRGPAQQ